MWVKSSGCSNQSGPEHSSISLPQDLLVAYLSITFTCAIMEACYDSIVLYHTLTPIYCGLMTANYTSFQSVTIHDGLSRSFLVYRFLLRPITVYDGLLLPMNVALSRSATVHYATSSTLMLHYLLTAYYSVYVYGLLQSVTAFHDLPQIVYYGVLRYVHVCINSYMWMSWKCLTKPLDF